MKLKTLEAQVIYMLEKHPKTRDDDSLLYACYLLYKKVPNVSVIEFFKNPDYYKAELGIASFESVGRCRRKVQESRPDLRPTKEARARKRENESRYRTYARG